MGYAIAQICHLNPLLGVIYMLGINYLTKERNIRTDLTSVAEKWERKKLIDFCIVAIPTIAIAGFAAGWKIIPTTALITIFLISRTAMFLLRKCASAPNLIENWFFQGAFHGAIGYFVTTIKSFPVIANFPWALLAIHTLNFVAKKITKGRESPFTWTLRHIVILTASALLGGYLTGWAIIPTVTLVVTSATARLVIQLCHGNKINLSWRGGIE